MNVLSTRSTDSSKLLIWQHADMVADWVETSRRKNQPEGAKVNEKSPKIQQSRDGHTKGDQQRKVKGGKS